MSSAAKEISMAVAIATVLSQLGGIFTLEEPKNGFSLWTTLFLLCPRPIFGKEFRGLSGLDARGAKNQI